MPSSNEKLTDKIRKENAIKKTSYIKVKLQGDVKLIEQLKFIIENSKSVLGVDSSVFLTEKMVESNRKYIEQLAKEIKDELENESKNSESEQQ